MALDGCGGCLRYLLIVCSFLVVEILPIVAKAQANTISLLDRPWGTTMAARKLQEILPIVAKAQANTISLLDGPWGTTMAARKLTGLAILGVGIYLLVDEDSGHFRDEVTTGASPLVITYSQVSDVSLFSLLAYCLIALGSLTALTALIACVGAVSHRRSLLSGSFSLQLLIFLALIGLGVYVYTEKDSIEVDKEHLRTLLKDNLLEAVKKYHDEEPYKLYMDAIQKKYQCCGADNGGGDYAPLLDMPCALLYADTPCLPPYFSDMEDKIGARQFFSDRMTIGLAAVLTLGAILLLNLILTTVLLISSRTDTS